MASVRVILRLHRYVSVIDRTPRGDRTMVQRVARKMLRWWLDRALGRGYGAFIGKGARIAKDVKFVHELYGVFIAGEAVIEEGCHIFQHVTIGAKKGPDNRYQAPRIGRNVVIGANATLLGRCVIGSGAKIGAGVTVVNAVIPDGAIVVNKSAYDLTNQRFIYEQ